MWLVAATAMTAADSHSVSQWLTAFESAHGERQLAEANRLMLAFHEAELTDGLVQFAPGTSATLWLPLHEPISTLRVLFVATNTGFCR